MTGPVTAEAAASQLVLSIFPGADLLGRGFEAEGFCVVRGPDLLWGSDVRRFHPPCGVFAGIIGGSPCQDFSRKRRAKPSGYGDEMIFHFARCVTEAGPDWFLMKNVPGVPDVAVDGYTVQRFNLNARECGVRQNRLRTFQFGSLDGKPLVIQREMLFGAVQPCCMASEGKSTMRRTFADFCELQGLPRDFDLPGLSIAAKYAAVGNGVPVTMARVMATAIHRRGVTAWTRLCVCECGRPVRRGQTLATPACRKRMQRRRDASGRNDAGGVTIPLFQ
ncbi:MAG: DNA cytosine methyltransferase [Verrucomicrobia bacterium]|nr:DNA cytosine methyltransferase [Verrucomicrobiota bacterium]